MDKVVYIPSHVRLIKSLKSQCKHLSSPGWPISSWSSRYTMRRNFCGRTIFWLRCKMPLFLSTWSLCHSFRSLRTNGDYFCFCPTVGFWFALMTFRTRPVWGSSFCALTISTTFTWLQLACDGMSTWWSSPSSSVRTINQIESPLDNVWIPQIEACELSGTTLSVQLSM